MKNSNPIAERVKNLIVKGRLEDAAEELISFFDENVLDEKDKDIFYLYNQTIHLTSQLNEIKNAQLSGLIESRDANLRRNNIRSALLEINNKIVQIQSGQRVHIPNRATESTSKGKTQNNKPLLIGLGILLLGVLAVFVGLHMFDRDNKVAGEALVTAENTLSSEEERRPIREVDKPADEVDARRRTERERQAAEKEERSQTATEGSSGIQHMTLVPDIQKMGAEGAVSGSVRSDWDGNYSPPSFGDNGFGKGVRGFLTFNLDNIPADSKIISAKLYCDQGGQTGDPFVFEEILIESVKIGNNLDLEDYNRNGVLVQKEKLRNFNRSYPIDIANAIRLALRNRGTQLTLRFRPSWGNNNDEVKDIWAFRYSSGFTRLEIEFE